MQKTGTLQKEVTESGDTPETSNSERPRRGKDNNGQPTITYSVKLFSFSERQRLRLLTTKKTFTREMLKDIPEDGK